MKDGCKVKICGITCVSDRDMVADAGADLFGVIFEVPFSPRSQKLEEAVGLLSDPPIPGVVLVYEPDWAELNYLLRCCRPFALQFLNRAQPADLTRLKNDFPYLSLWQSLHLPAVQSQDSLAHQSDVSMLLSTVNELAANGLDVVVFDTVASVSGQVRYGGTGQVSDWALVRELVKNIRLPVYLAGGLNPDNVWQALESVCPAGIDLCSGVESTVGRKDPEKVRALISRVRSWQETRTA